MPFQSVQYDREYEINNVDTSGMIFYEYEENFRILTVG